MAGEEIPIIAEELIASRIYLIRGKQVMLSHDLADLSQVETKVLNQQVKRNIGKFPPRYMFRLNKQELENQRSHFVTFKELHIKYLPFAFTEHGILMQQIQVILEHLKQMEKMKEQELKHHKRRRIGYK